MSTAGNLGPGEPEAAVIPPAGHRTIWTWAVVIAIGGFLFGFDTGVISGAIGRASCRERVLTDV